MATAVNTAASPGAVVSLVLAANPSRVSALFTNNGAVPVFLGQIGVTLTTGIPLQPGNSFADNASSSAWYGITAGGSGELVICEVS